MVLWIARRRAALMCAALAALALLAGSAAPAAAQQAHPPIIFVHGNGDSAALWYPTIWRFESAGYDPALLFAFNIPHPNARDNDAKPQANRSSTVDQAAALSAMVTRVLLTTHQAKVALVGVSRGGFAIRNYLKNAGGAATVAVAVLCSTPNHGVTALPVNLGGEFNGMGPFLTQLNAGSEVVPGVAFFTLRSDKNDKYAQPTGEALGLPGVPTGVTHAGPELKGAKNIVLEGVDHLEAGLHPRAFREIFRAITGEEPSTVEIVPEAHAVLNGMVSGFENGAATNLPLAGAQVSVFEVDSATGERKGAAVHQATTGADGLWGTFTAKPDAYYEWVIAAAGYPTTHIYRTPFPRSSGYVDLRLAPVDKRLAGAGSVVVLSRTRGYLGVGRDTFTLDGAPPDGVAKGVPSSKSGVKTYPAEPSRSVAAVLNGEHMTVRTFPLAEGHIVFAEFHY